MSIAFPQGFVITSAEPIDSRLVMTTAQMRSAGIRMPPYYITVCADGEDAGKVFIFDKSSENVDDTYGRFRPMSYQDLADLPTLADIVGDTTHRVVTDEEIAAWNAKQSALSEAQMDAVNSGITASMVEALESIESGAQTNIIEVVKVDGTPLEVIDKTVDIVIEGKVDKLQDKPTAGTFMKVTINSEGQVTQGQPLLKADIPNIEESQVDGLEEDLDSKVDKVAGKGLSTEDYTTSEKTKLANIEAAAQVNKIETIKFGNDALPILSPKTVSISNDLSIYDNSTSGFITKDVSNLTNYYTKPQVDDMIAVQMQFQTVSANASGLPDVSNPNTYTIYLIPSTTSKSKNVKDEYIWTKDPYTGEYTWEQIGSTTMKLNIVQSASGITINDDTLQDATLSQDGLMSKELVLKLKEAHDYGTDHESRVYTLESDNTSNKSRIGQLEAHDSDHEERISTLENNDEDHEARMVSLETDNTSNKSRISQLEGHDLSHATRLSALETASESYGTRIGTLETHDTSYASRIGVLETDNTSNKSRITSLETDNTSNKDRLDSLEEDSEDYGARIAPLEADNDSNKGRLDALEDSNSDHEERIASLETDNTSNKSRLTSLEEDSEDYGPRISSLEADNTDNKSRISSLEEDDLSNIERLDNLESNDDNFESRIGQLEGHDADYASRLSTVESASDDYEVRISAMESEVSEAVATINDKTPLTMAIGQWSPTITYRRDSTVVVDGVIYVSTENGNLGNDPTDEQTTKWTRVIGGGDSGGSSGEQSDSELTMGYHSRIFGNDSDTDYVIPHKLNSYDFLYTIRTNELPYRYVQADVFATSKNLARVHLTDPPGDNALSIHLLKCIKGRASSMPATSSIVNITADIIQFGNGQDLEYELTHNLNSYDILWSLRETDGDKQYIRADFYVLNKTTVKVVLTEPPGENGLTLNMVKCVSSIITSEDKTEVIYVDNPSSTWSIPSNDEYPAFIQTYSWDSNEDYFDEMRADVFQPAATAFTPITVTFDNGPQSGFVIKAPSENQYRFENSDTWVINHGTNQLYAVQIYDEQEGMVTGDVAQINGTITISFDQNRTGWAVLVKPQMTVHFDNSETGRVQHNLGRFVGMQVYADDLEGQAMLDCHNIDENVCEADFNGTFSGYLLII